MDFTMFSHVNYGAVVVSAVIFFILGSLWYSVLFRSSWLQELKRHNIVIKEPTKNSLLIKMLLTFGANLLASYAMACLVIMTGSTTVQSGLMLGIITALGFAATALGLVFIWESRSLRLFLIDSGYPALGIIITAALLSFWK